MKLGIPMNSLRFGIIWITVVFANCDAGRISSHGGCSAETDSEFCTRLDKNCDPVTAADNCGTQRTADCGSCTDPEVCGGSGIGNVCGTCLSEKDELFCAHHGANCDPLTAVDNCGKERAVESCGVCFQPETCGGSGIKNFCGSSENAWPMAAGNPQRTSWTPEEVSGDIFAKTIRAEWYHPIDAFVPPNFQVIAANDLVYLSSARGLYAFKYDTGELAWRYDTEIPLGNSPTIALVDGISMAVVGSYERKLIALNALTGTKLWEFAGAKAGFDANPLVVNQTVYVGARDGYFYAVNAKDGSLKWQYPSADQEPLGSIRLSPAYKDGVIYFATGYNYAYALNIDGTLKWKSQKLPGDGYYAYWPVVFTNPDNNQDYVILSSKLPYRESMKPGTMSIICEIYWDPGNYAPCDSYGMYGQDISAFPQSITLPDSWAQGKDILDFSVVMDYLNQKPHLKTYPILDASTGAESTTFPSLPQSNPTPLTPPVVVDDLLFISNDYGTGRHKIMGWRFGTSYFAVSSLEGAGDEPIILSAGGNNIYKVLCCSRAAWYTSLPSLSSFNTFWPYGGNPLADIAPGYDEKLWYLDPANPLDNISVIFGNVNGVYGYHGDQNPMVPYKGMLFTIKGNTLLAFGSGSGPAPGNLGLVPSSAPTLNLPALSDTELKSRLETEIQKIVSAGLLKPGYQDDSQFTCHYPAMDNYFDNPGDTLYTLSMAYLYLSEPLKTEVKNYLDTMIYPTYFQNGITSCIGWSEGAQRDSIPYPPDLVADMQTLSDNYCNRGVNPNNIYALYQYAQNVSRENVQNIYQLAVDTGFPPDADDASLIRYPYELNAFLAGYYGFIKLQELAEKTDVDADLRSQAIAAHDRLKKLRLDNFSKDTPFNDADGYGKNFLNISRNFIGMTPELAADFNLSKLSAVQEAINEYNAIAPYWFVSRFNAAPAESGLQNLYDYPAIFQAKAYILKESRAELSKWLDVPAFEKGDLFYIQNLVAAIKAP